MKRKTVKILVGIAVSVAAIGLLGWRAMQPKLHGATHAEIRAVLPAELLVTEPTDPAAQERFLRFTRLLEGFDKSHYTSLQSSVKKAAPDGVLRESRLFRTEQQPMLRQIDAILSAGPLLAANKWRGDDGNYGIFVKLKDFYKCLCVSGRTLIANGDYRSGTDLLILGFRLDDSLRHSGFVVIGYLVETALSAIKLAATEAALKDPSYPAAECRRLLDAMRPSPVNDEVLRVTLRNDFQQEVLPDIGNPRKIANDLKKAVTDTPSEVDENAPIVGTYDAIETAKAYGRMMKEVMSNTEKPYSAISHEESEAIAKDSDSLPQPVEDSTKESSFTKTWNDLKYRFLMDNGRNTLGREALSLGSVGQEFNQLSCRERAYNDAVRVLAAARLYRVAHAGSLPPTSSGFVPYLGAWPTDPFSGKPMIYNPVRQVVYSVGADLVDNGGVIAKGLNGGPDIGVSLVSSQ